MFLCVLGLIYLFDNVNKSALHQLLLLGCLSERDHCFVTVQMCRYLQHKLTIICTYD